MVKSATMLTILSGWASVQDSGRPGYAALGLPASGPLDPYAHAAANRLLDNPSGAAALEVIGVAAFSLSVATKCVLAVTGADLQLWVEGRPLPAWYSIFLRPGSVLELRGRRRLAGNGGVAYLAVAGGLQCPPYCGSQSTYVGAAGALPGLCGRLLRPGDELACASSGSAQAGRRAAAWHEIYPGPASLAVEWGPHAGLLGRKGRAALLASEYTVAEGNRMGWRLAAPLAIPQRAGGGEMISAPTLRGGIQLPPGGQPIILGPDQQTSGGYPLVAVVHPTSWPALGQLLAGDRLRLVYRGAGGG